MERNEGQASGPTITSVTARLQDEVTSLRTDLDELRERLEPLTGPPQIAHATVDNAGEPKKFSKQVENLLDLANNVEGLRHGVRDLLDRMEV